MTDITDKSPRRTSHPLSEVATILTGVFSVAPPSLARGDQAIPMVTVRWLSAPREPLPALLAARVSDARADRYRLRTGDVLVPSRSTSIRVAMVPKELDARVFNATLLAVRCSERLLPSLLVAYLSHPAGAMQLAAASQSGTAQMNLTAAGLGTIRVPVPPLERQHRLVELLTAANAVHQSAHEAAELRLTLARDFVISRMLEGEPVNA